MSHAPLRKENNCLNCGATLHGRYCHVCGQENIVAKETFWHMFLHFFYDITHFDSKFFETVKDLLFRPGFLTNEYVKGRRASYLHPVRMYVFTSAIFFLVFFSFFSNDSVKFSLDQKVTPKERENYIQELEQRSQKDTANKELKQKLARARDTNVILTPEDLIKDETGGASFGVGFKSVGEYDSAQKKLPASQRDGWFKKRMTKKWIELQQKFAANPEEAKKELSESLLHRMPYMLFVSLPLFALLLQLVYIRRKQFYYVDHGIFTIHLYIFTFLLLLLVFIVNGLENITKWNLSLLVVILFFVGLFYMYKAMRNFYGQKRFKTIVKFLFVIFSSFIMMLVLFMFFVFFSAVTL